MDNQEKFIALNKQLLQQIEILKNLAENNFDLDAENVTNDDLWRVENILRSIKCHNKTMQE